MVKSRVLIPDAPFCSVTFSVSFLLKSVFSGLPSPLLELVSPTRELSEALHRHSVPKGVLVSWFSLGMAFSGCCCDLELVGCAGVSGTLDAVLPASLSSWQRV